MFNPPVGAVGKRMPFGALAALATLALGLTAQGASAQLAPGYSGTSSEGRMFVGNEETWQTLRVFGACYARLNPPRALEIIAAEPGSAQERETFRRVMTGPQDCMGYVRRMRAPFAYMRGAIAEGLCKRNVAVPESLRRAPPARGADSHSVAESAGCVAATRAEQVRALLATPLGSRRERDAAQAVMRDAFPACMPSGVSVDLSPALVRYALAEALLRLPSTSATGQR